MQKQTGAQDMTDAKTFQNNTAVMADLAACGEAEKLHHALLDTCVPSGMSTPLMAAHLQHVLEAAATNGHSECVARMCTGLPAHWAHVSLDATWAMIYAAEEGHDQCLRLILEHTLVDPKAKKSFALQMATANQHDNCVDILWDVSNPNAALKDMQQEYNAEIWWPLQQRIQMHKDKKKLQKSTTCATSKNKCATPRKM